MTKKKQEVIEFDEGGEPIQYYTTKDICDHCKLSPLVVKRIITKVNPEVFGKRGSYNLYGARFMYEVDTIYRPNPAENRGRSTKGLAPDFQKLVEDFQILQTSSIEKFQILQTQLQKVEGKCILLEEELGAFKSKTSKTIKWILGKLVGTK